MAERKSGPVKPPVIDLKAREASPRAEDATADTAGTQASKPSGKAGAAGAGDKPPAADERPADAKPAAAAGTEKADKPKPDETAAAEPKPEASRTPPPPPPRPQARLAMPWSAISIAAGAGALLGAGLVYLLASWLPLPTAMPPLPDPGPELAALGERATAQQERLAALEETTADTRISLDATIAQLDSGLAAVRGELEALREAMPEPVASDLGDIEAQLQTLESRVDATAAGASSADAAALAESLASIEANIAGLGDRMATLEAELAASRTALAEMEDRVDGIGSAVSARNTALTGGDVGPAVRLPLVVSGLESAFASGRPYATELQSLTTLLPDLEVPAAVASASESGLPRADVLARRFNERLPDILAARTGTTTGDWSQDAIAWAKALLALRPAEEMEGDSPEAIVSRLEGAMERRDFVAAAGLMTELPEPMRLAAGELPGAILLRAEAETFIARLRAQALAPPAETAR